MLKMTKNVGSDSCDKCVKCRPHREDQVAATRLRNWLAKECWKGHVAVLLLLKGGI